MQIERFDIKTDPQIPMWREKQSRLPGRQNQMSRLPGRQKKQIFRSVSREQLPTQKHENRQHWYRRADGGHLQVSTIPIAGFSPSRSFSYTDADSDGLTPNSSVAGQQELSDGIYRWPSGRSVRSNDQEFLRMEDSDSLLNVPDVPSPRSRMGFRWPCQKIEEDRPHSPLQLVPPNMMFQISDDDTSFIEIHNDELVKFSDDLSELDPQSPRRMQYNLSYGPIRSSASNNDHTDYSETSEDLPPVPVETDDDDSSLSHANSFPNSAILYRLSSNVSQSTVDSDLTLPPVPILRESPSLTRHRESPPALPPSLNSDIPEQISLSNDDPSEQVRTYQQPERVNLKRKPQLSLKRIPEVSMSLKRIPEVSNSPKLAGKKRGPSKSMLISHNINPLHVSFQNATKHQRAYSDFHGLSDSSFHQRADSASHQRADSAFHQETDSTFHQRVDSSSHQRADSAFHEQADDAIQRRPDSAFHQRAASAPHHQFNDAFQQRADFAFQQHYDDAFQRQDTMETYESVSSYIATMPDIQNAVLSSDEESDEVADVDGPEQTNDAIIMISPVPGQPDLHYNGYSNEGQTDTCYSPKRSRFSPKTLSPANSNNSNSTFSSMRKYSSGDSRRLSGDSRRYSDDSRRFSCEGVSSPKTARDGESDDELLDNHETDDPDIILSPVSKNDRACMKRGMLFLKQMHSWDQCWAVLTRDRDLILYSTEEELSACLTVHLEHVKRAVSLAPLAHQPCYPFQITLHSNVDIGGEETHLSYRNPGAQPSSLVFAAGDRSLCADWLQCIQSLLVDDDVEKVGIAQPLEFDLEMLEDCFREFEGAVRLKEWVQICNLSGLTSLVDPSELFSAFDVYDNGFISWHRVKEELRLCADRSCPWLTTADRLSQFIKNSKENKLYKNHHKKMVTISGLIPRIVDNEHWLEQIEHAFGDYDSDDNFYPLVKDITGGITGGTSVEFVFPQELSQLMLEEITTHIKRILIECTDQRPESISVAFPNLQDFLKNYETNEIHFIPFEPLLE